MASSDYACFRLGVSRATALAAFNRVLDKLNEVAKAKSADAVRSLQKEMEQANNELKAANAELEAELDELTKMQNAAESSAKTLETLRSEQQQIEELIEKLKASDSRIPSF